MKPIIAWVLRLFIESLADQLEVVRSVIGLISLAVVL